MNTTEEYRQIERKYSGSANDYIPEKGFNSNKRTNSLNSNPELFQDPNYQQTQFRPPNSIPPPYVREAVLSDSPSLRPQPVLTNPNPLTLNQLPLLTKLTENASPTVVSTAIVLGFCSGYTFKLFGKTLTIFAGFLCMILQVLAYFKLITIHWEKLSAHVTEKLDLDGDGKITISDALAIFGNFIYHLAIDLPSSVSFVTFFWIGYQFI
ncbi:hypothetical protein BC833DRAFT_574907 [Globomyces pollinis-pini]|nr:hypothetical protein BC833DRAFT_574907 [Globomyces pollinis-pini]